MSILRDLHAGRFPLRANPHRSCKPFSLSCILLWAMWSAASRRLRCTAFRQPVAERIRSSRSLAQCLGVRAGTREKGVKYTAIVHRIPPVMDGLRRTSRNAAKAADGIADTPSGSRSSYPPQDPRLPRWAVRAVCSAASRCRSQPQQTFLAVAREVPVGTCSPWQLMLPPGIRPAGQPLTGHRGSDNAHSRLHGRRAGAGRAAYPMVAVAYAAWRAGAAATHRHSGDDRPHRAGGAGGRAASRAGRHRVRARRNHPAGQ